MKDRMKRLTVLCITAALCVGNVYAEAEPADTEAKLEMYSSQPESTAVETEVHTETETHTETEAPTETEVPAESETHTDTEAPTESADTSSVAETETQKESASDTEASHKDTEKNTSAEESSEEVSLETETEGKKEKAALDVKDQNGNRLSLEELKCPSNLTVEGETHTVNYLQGVYKVTLPEGSDTLQITVLDQTEKEEILLSKWSGYLTEQDHVWYLCPDDPVEGSYTVQENVYTANLEKFAISMEDITREQMAVYGELDEDTDYAEVLVTGEDRSELILVEYESPESQEENTEISESETEEYTESDATTEVEEAAGIALLTASSSQVDKTYTSTGKSLASAAAQTTPKVGSIGGEWQILGLARSGRLDEKVAEKYLTNVLNTLKETNGVLHAKKYTEYSRVVLALTAMGIDVTNVGGYNLLEPLADYDQTVWQGVNGATWALIAFDSHDYEIPKAASGKTQNSRDKLIDNILGQEVSGGGWDLSGRSADPDVTAMAIQALAPYYKTNTKVKAAIDRGISKLSSMQKKNGSFATYGTESSESCAQVIVALTAMGINPNTDSRFVKNGKSVIDALLTYANADGTFRHVLDGSADGMATEQAYYALTAYERFTGGKNRLYDMSDVELPSDKEKAEMVEKLISAIPGSITLSDKTQINAAKAMYDSLNATQKALVANYSHLENALKKLQELEKNSSSGTGNGSGNSSGNGSGSDTKTTTTKKKTRGSTKKVNLVSSSGKVGGTAAGKTTSGKSSTDTKEKESEKTTEKTTEKKGGTKTEKEVTSLITEMNSLFSKTKKSGTLPDEASEYTDAQKEQILDMYRTYTALTDAQKKEVEQDSHYKDYEKAVEGLREVNHYDEVSGVDLRDNEEDVLPWYVQLETGSITVEADQAEAVRKALKDQGELLNLMDISLMDLLGNTQWEPEDLVRVSVPNMDLGEYENAVIVHLKDDGSMEFIDAHIAGQNLEFDTDQFSRFGIAGYHGSMEELMQSEDTSGKTVWMYLIPGACAAALLIILGAVRLTTGKKKGAKNSER